MESTLPSDSLLQHLRWTHKSYPGVKAEIPHSLPPLPTNSLIALLLWQPDPGYCLLFFYGLLAPATAVHKNIFQKPLASTKGSEYIQGWRMIQSLWVLKSWYPFRNHWKECQQALITMVLPGRWRSASTHWISTNSSFQVSHGRKWVAILAIFREYLTPLKIQMGVWVFDTKVYNTIYIYVFSFIIYIYIYTWDIYIFETESFYVVLTVPKLAI